jgi:hypothetical protein
MEVLNLLLVDVRVNIEFVRIVEDFERLVDVFLRLLVLKDVFDSSTTKKICLNQTGKK